VTAAVAGQIPLLDMAPIQPPAPDRPESDPLWRDTATRVLIRVAADSYRQGTTFQASDLARAGCPEPGHPNQWGALFRSAAAEGLITRVGAEPSTRGTVHGSLVYRWRGTEYATDRAAELVDDTEEAA
jgi:hypothetical protein